MSTLQVRQLEGQVRKTYSKRIDLTDVATKPKTEQDNMFLTRALAVFALESLTGVTIGSTCVVDGYNDNGIDALYCNKKASELWLVQSKWIKSGNGEPGTGDLGKFLKGVSDLIECKFTKFNARLQAWRSEIMSLLEDPRLKIHIVLAYTGDQFGQHSQTLTDEFIQEQNNITELVHFHRSDLKRLHEWLVAGVRGEAINEDIRLLEWGTIDHPLNAYYGYIAASDIYALWQQHGPTLFIENLRNYMGSTEVNDAIQETLLHEPEKFFYMNNGITMIARSVAKKPLGGADRKSGDFQCQGLSVINGAQTVGCIGSIPTSDQAKIEKAKVLCRLIAYGDSDSSIAEDLTRACNTQNAILAKDFVSLDENQKRLGVDFSLKGLLYIYRSGEDLPAPDKGCSVEEATIALSCMCSDIGITVIAKTKVSRLWTDPKVYPRIFNSGVTADHVWSIVKFMRIVDEQLRVLADGDDEQLTRVAIHGNRFILHALLQKYATELAQSGSVHKGTVKSKVKAAAKETVAVIQDLYPDSQYHTLFKNLTKTKVVYQEVSSKL